MSRRVVIASPKGGVGKTTVALNLAAAMADRGRRTLLVDLDPQGGIGHAMARGETAFTGLVELLMGEATGDDAVLRTQLDRLCILPRGRLDPIDAPELEDALRDPRALRFALERLEKEHDLVLLDTPAGLGGITRAALQVAESVLVPLQTEPLALRTLPQILRVMEHVREHDNPELRLLGVVLTMVERRMDATQAVLREVWTDFSGVLDTLVPRHEVFARASLEGIPASFLGGRVSPEVKRFDMLAAELEPAIWKEGASDERRARQLL